MNSPRSPGVFRYQEHQNLTHESSSDEFPALTTELQACYFTLI